MKIFVGISGASGVIYAGHLLKSLESLGHSVTACFSDGAIEVIRAEGLAPGVAMESTDRDLIIDNFATFHGIDAGARETVHPDDIGNAFASGSHQTDAAVVCPCSMSSLACIATGITRNLIHRVADVMLKESRPLILVPRETPLSEIHLYNMLRLRRAGAIMLPAMPAYYQGPETIDELADFIAGKVLDSLGVKHELFNRWEGLS